jgi:hypothetical protein
LQGHTIGFLLPSAENAACVNACGIVKDLHIPDRSVAIYYKGIAAIFICPWEADRQTVLVGFAGGIAVKTELADTAGTASLEFFFASCMGNNKFAIV